MIKPEADLITHTFRQSIFKQRYQLAHCRIVTTVDKTYR